MVVRASRSGSVILAPEVWMPRLQAEGWSLVAAEPTDPEVTEPTPLSDVTWLPSVHPVEVVLAALVEAAGGAEVDAASFLAAGAAASVAASTPEPPPPPAPPPTRSRGRGRGVR